MGVAIWLGQKMPLDLADAFSTLSDEAAHKTWDVLILAYCLVAAVVPVWLLLQPRGHLGGYFLYVALGGACIGVMLGGHEIQYPAFTSWTFTSPSGATKNLAPFLFITIACGACSGFHSLIASGTTSKQLRVETDARPIGYGAMLLEGDGRRHLAVLRDDARHRFAARHRSAQNEFHLRHRARQVSRSAARARRHSPCRSR